MKETTRAWERNILYDVGLFVSLGYVGGFGTGYFARLFYPSPYLPATSREDARNKVQTLLFWRDREC